MTNAGPQQPSPGFTTHYTESADRYIQMAKNANPPLKQTYLLQAAGRLLQDHNLASASQVLSQIPPPMPQNLSNEYTVLQANLATLENKGQQALTVLQGIKDANGLSTEQKIAYYQLTALGNLQIRQPLRSAEARMTLEPLLSDATLRQNNRQETWADLNQIPTHELAEEIRKVPYGQLQGWLQIVFITKSYGGTSSTYNNEIEQWQKRYPRHPANSLLPSRSPSTPWSPTKASSPLSPTPAEVKGANVALLLPLSGKLATSGEAIKNGYMAAYFDAKTIPGAPLAVRFYDTNGKNIQTLYKKAVTEGATFIVGPLTKEQVESVEKMGDLPVPTLGLNYTPGGSRVKNLYEFGLSPQDEARQVASAAHEAGHKRALIIAPANSWGQGVANTFRKAWEKQGGIVVDSLPYTKQTRLDQGIRKLLQVTNDDMERKRNKTTGGNEIADKPQHREDADMIFLVTAPSVARQIKPLLRFYFADELTVYATSQVYSGHPNPQQDKDLNGILFCDIPWILDSSNSKIQTAYQRMRSIMPNGRPQSTRLYAFGLDAYALTQQLTSGQKNRVLGMTGMLYFGNNQQVFRQLQWADFRNGLPHLIHGR